MVTIALKAFEDLPMHCRLTASSLNVPGSCRNIDTLARFLLNEPPARRRCRRLSTKQGFP